MLSVGGDCRGSEDEGDPNLSEEISKSEIEKMRFDYAWRWFDFHAKQRTTMFNFFLIVTGIVANGIFALLKDPVQQGPATIASFSGALITIGFIFLEFRNRALVKYAEDVLFHIEKSQIFSWDVKTSETNAPLALIYRERAGGMLKGFCRHKFWIPIIQGLVGIGFLILGVHSLTMKVTP